MRAVGELRAEATVAHLRPGVVMVRLFFAATGFPLPVDTNCDLVIQRPVT
jgi:hypothetical protein